MKKKYFTPYWFNPILVYKSKNLIMKKIALLLFCLTFVLTSFAQKLTPEIKQGTVLLATAMVNGQEFPLTLTVNKVADPFTLGWSVQGYGDGAFEMASTALENGNSFFVSSQPALGATKLGANETFGIISKSAYKGLIEAKTFTYGGLKFKIKTPETSPVKMGDKELDVTHVVSEDGKIELWILNNASFPLIIQSSGLTIDLAVSEIK